MVADDREQPWYLYLLECENGYLYGGITNDIERRFEAHQQGKGAKFTRINPPLRILGAAQFENRSAASIAEPKLKKLNRSEKLDWARQHTYRQQK